MENLLRLGLVPFFTQQLNDVELLVERVGRVTLVQRSLLTVICDSAEHKVSLSSSLSQSSSEHRPTVGDWVVLDESLSKIEQVLERKSLFKRVAAGHETDIQPIAANIDTLFIVTSCNDEFKESRLERYLTLCVNAGVQPVIILSKVDLSDDVDSYIQRAQNVQSGVVVETVNSLDNDSLKGVNAWVSASSTIALVGSSGVGKSTLLNALAEDDLAMTNDVREQDNKGKHTTTHRQLFQLPSGGLLIDVPGMRELKVAEIEQSIGEVFDDIEQLSKQCRFADCQHINEPSCAVIEAIQLGTVDSRRLANYHKLLRENKIANASLSEKRADGRDLAKMIKQAINLKQNKSRN